MSRPLALVLAAALALAAAAPALGQPEDEHVFTLGALTVAHARARAAAAGEDTLVFLEIENDGAAERLLAAATPVAATVEIVGLALEGDRIGMVPVGPIDLPTGVFELDPGGLGLALHDLAETLIVGTEFELTLTFAGAGELTVHVLVEPAGATAHSHQH